MPRTSMSFSDLSPSVKTFIRLFNTARKNGSGYSGVTSQEKNMILDYNTVPTRIRSKQTIADHYGISQSDVNLVFRRMRKDIHTFMANEEMQGRVRQLIQKDEWNPSVIARFTNVATHQWSDYLRNNPV